MNPRKITFQAPVSIPPPPEGKTAFLGVFDSSSGFSLVWIELDLCPSYIHSPSGKKARLTTSLTNNINEIQKHGKVTLIFEDIFVNEDSKEIYRSWEPSEWIPSKD